jgi:Rv0078B-related antitoxin
MWLDPRRYEMTDDAMVEVFRGKTPAEKLAMLDGLWRMARELIEDKLRLDYPDWSADQIAREAARRLSHGAV